MLLYITIAPFSRSTAFELGKPAPPARLGRLQSIQGLPSIMPHGMAETPRSENFSFLFQPRLQQLQLQLHTDNDNTLSVTWLVQACHQQILLMCKGTSEHSSVYLQSLVDAQPQLHICTKQMSVLTSTGIHTSFCARRTKQIFVVTSTGIHSSTCASGIKQISVITSTGIHTSVCDSHITYMALCAGTG